MYHLAQRRGQATAGAFTNVATEAGADTNSDGEWDWQRPITMVTVILTLLSNADR